MEHFHHLDVSTVVRRYLLGVAIALTPNLVLAQAPESQVSLRNLAEFEGQYQYRDGLTLSMVTSGKQLVAIIGDAKYLLRPAATDTFLNPAGNSLLFVRDPNDRIVAFRENGEEFARLSSNVPTAARLLLKARTNGPNGLPVVYRYERPSRLSDGVSVGKAGPGTLPSQVAEQLVNGVIDGTYADVHSLLIYHKGALLLEEYFYGFDRERPHEMRSFTKSVISLLAGAAIDRGFLSDREPVLARLGYPAFQNPDQRKAKVTLTHLLSNQSGFPCNEHDGSSPGHEMKLFETPDWVKAFVDLPMVAEPGTVGSYCSANFYAFGRIIERAAGKSLPEFADQVLFGPLGIRRADWKWNFTLDRSQRNAFGQIFLRPRDINTIMLSGNGGQKVYLVPSLDLIVVSTGNAFFVDSPLNKMMAGVLLPAMMESGPK